MAALMEARPRSSSVQTGSGVAWGDHTGCMFCAVARSSVRAIRTIWSHWLPALDGVVAKLERGGTVADVGCGHGWSTVLMAKAFPNSQFVGLRLPPRLDRAGAAHAADTASPHTRSRSPRRMSIRATARLGDFLRLPARHGRSGRRGGACPAIAESGRHLDGCRADGRRRSRKPQSGRADILRRFDDDLCADFTGPAGRSGPRRAGRRSEVARSDHFRRLRQRRPGAQSRRGPGQLRSERGHQTAVGENGRKNPAGQIAQRLQGLVGLRADLVQERAGARRSRFQHLTREASIDGDGHKVLLSTVVDVPLQAPPFGILRGDNALARRPQLVSLGGELGQPRLELERQPDIAERWAGLRGQIGQQCTLGRGERFTWRFAYGDFADRACPGAAPAPSDRTSPRWPRPAR